MPGVDELLRRSVDELTEEVSPGDFAQVARRRRRLRHLRRVRSAALALVVVAASAGGLLALARVFGVGETAPRPAAILGDGAVAFVSDADGDAEIYLLHGHGTPIQLTDNDVDDLAPAWSPDGTRIAFLRREEREFHIFVMNADGSEEREVIPAGSGVVAGELTGDAWFSRLSWSPDGGRIVFAGRRSTADPSCPVDPCSSELYSVSVEGSELEQLTHTPMLDEWDPAWAPKGGLIAFVRTGRRTEGDPVPPRIPQLHVMAPDGSKVRTLTSVGAGATKPSWSPAGTMIAFESDGDIAVVNADGTGLRRLVNPPPPDAANRAPHPDYGNYEPSWSPDGLWIVFSSDREGSRALYVMPANGTEDQAIRLTDTGWGGEQRAPTWQPGTVPAATEEGDPRETWEGEGRWEELPEAPLSARHRAHAFTVGGRVLVVGGSDAALCPADLHCAFPDPPALRDGAAYDLSSGTWRPIADAPVPLGGLRAAGLGDTLYLWTPGAGPPGEVAAFLSYDVGEERWERLPMPPADRGVLKLVATDTAIVGYQDSQEGRAGPDLLYDPATRTWTELPPDPIAPSFDRAMVWTGSELILLGVEVVPQPASRGPALYRAGAFDPSSATWRRLPDSEVSAWDPSWFWSGGLVVNPNLGTSDGGDVNPWDRPYPHGGMFDPATERWSDLPDPPSRSGPLWGLSMGGAETVVSPEGWMLHVPTGTWLRVPLPEREGIEGRAATLVGDDLFLWGGARWKDTEGTLFDHGWIWRPPWSEHEG